jgi:iron complex outermembrane recepter protein
MYSQVTPRILLYLLMLLVPLLGSASAVTADEPPQKMLPATIFIEGAPLRTTLREFIGSSSVVKRDQITYQGTESIQQQINAIPNLNWAGGSSRPRFFQIRGIGELEQYEGAPNTSVAVVVDDVDVTGVGAGLTLFDVAQIEVLRGPQATQFGSSALAGALKLTTTETTPYQSGFLQVGSGNDAMLQGGGALGGPATPSTEFRVGAFFHRQDGFRRNTFLDSASTNNREEFTGRAKMKAALGDDTTVAVSILSARLNNGYDAFSIFNGFTTQSDRPGRDDEGINLISFKVSHNLTSRLSLTSISSFYRSELNNSFDGDWGNNLLWGANAPYDFFQDSSRRRSVAAQELRVGNAVTRESLSWIAGTYFQTFREGLSTDQFSNGALFEALDSDYDARSSAVFSSMRMPLSERSHFEVEGRLEHRSASFTDSRPSDRSFRNTMAGGKVGFHFEPSSRSDWYIFLARGFKGGGVNTGRGVPQERQQYSPESLITIEGGNRAHFFDDFLSMSHSLFFSQRRDQQVKLAFQDDPADPLSFTYATDNAAKGYVTGIESESAVRMSPFDSINFSGSILKGVVSSSDERLASLNRRSPSHAPQWQYALSYRRKVSERLFWDAGVTGKASFYFDDSNNQRTYPFHLLSSGFTYQVGKWTLQLWGRNLTDKRYAVRGFFFGNEPPAFTSKRYVQRGDPRTFGLTALYRF